MTREYSSLFQQQEGNAIIQLLQEERDYFKKEYELLRSKGTALPMSPPTKDRTAKMVNA